MGKFYAEKAGKKSREQVIAKLTMLRTWAKYVLKDEVIDWIDDAIEMLEHDEKMFMSHYIQGRHDETGLRDGTIMQTHSPD